MLNDQVAMFINYFSSPRGKATLEHAWARVRPLSRHDLAHPEGGRRSAGPDLPGAGRVGLPAAGAFASRRARHVAVHGRSRASLYGLERNWWVDDRQDPEKATRAAARHLKDLYNQFGDWYLAMAAYNSGASTVQHAVERTGYADFWELYQRGVLPQETRNYVPIILAVTIMAKNPEQYGLERVAPEPAPQIDQVTIDYPVDLRLVAECVDTSVDYLQELNPSLLRMTTPKDQTLHPESSGRIAREVRDRHRRRSRRTCGPTGAITMWNTAIRWPRSRANITPRPSSIAEANNLDRRRGEGRLQAHHSDRAGHARTPKPSPIRTTLRITKCARATPWIPWLTTSRFRSISCGNGTTCGERR